MLIRRIGLAVVLVLLVGFTAVVAQDFDEVQFTSIKAADNIYMLQGAGGNIGLFFGPDGVFLIDDQFAPLHEKLVAQITELSGGAATDLSDAFLINTHFHPDHTDGNEIIGESGGIIFAHENVRQRLSVEQFVPFFNSRHPALSAAGLPVITFTRDLTFHLNGDSISVLHLRNAHTDGDAIVHFTRANVIHTGDIVFLQTYPLIDLDNGGSVAGMIGAVETILDLADDQTIIIPGHGNISNRSELVQYHLMLTTIYEKASQMVKDGKSLDEIQAAGISKDFDETCDGFIAHEAFIGLVYRDLTEAGR